MINPNDLYEEIRIAGEEAADKESAAAIYEDTRRHLRAKLMVETGQQSTAKAEMLAEASDEYRVHIETGIHLRKEATKAKVKYETLKIKVELIRSIEATNRAQMNMR